jgi:hypothetical protein
MRQKIIILYFCISLLATFLVLNSTSLYCCGVPLLIYSTWPLGNIFLLLATYTYVTFFSLSAFLVRKSKKKIFYWLLIVSLFFVFNIIASKFFYIELSDSFIDSIIPK